MLKNSVFCAILCAFFCASAVYAQEALPCTLRLNIVSFTEGTTDINPVEAASINLIDLKKKKAERSGNSISEYLFDGLAQEEYKVSVSKAGYRTSNDSFQLDCSKAFEGKFNYTVIMWEGDPKKTVNFLRADEAFAEKTADKNKSYRLGPSQTEPDSEDSINGSALMLAVPKKPKTAKAVGASGAVNVRVLLDKDGYVVAAKAISGHPLLMGDSVLAAKASRFKQTLLSGKPVKVDGIIVYNFQ